MQNKFQRKFEKLSKENPNNPYKHIKGVTIACVHCGCHYSIRGHIGLCDWCEKCGKCFEPGCCRCRRKEAR